jgi:2-desacetyl-2-hydroxyethyl bacteriochlorophyllide A dehydrogenase
MPERRELWFERPLAVTLRQGAGRALGPGEVRARALASGVSQGTELLLYRGEGPTPFDPSLDTEGAPTYPRRYGYAWVGELTESRHDAWRVGARVFALLPHGDEHTLPAERARALPEGVPATRAVLAANLETALTAIWDAALGLGDRVLVIGGGTVGLLTGLLARRAGAGRLALVEPSLKRREAALALGFDEALAPADHAARAEADVVFEASGDPACLDRAVASARTEGTVVVLSFYGERRHPVALGSDFHRRRLRLCSSQVSAVPPSKAPRWSHARRFELVTALLADARLDGILEPVAFDEAPAVYARLAADPGSALQVVFHY